MKKATGLILIIVGVLVLIINLFIYLVNPDIPALTFAFTSPPVVILAILFMIIGAYKMLTSKKKM